MSMGILAETPKSGDILAQNGFTHETKSVNGALTDCYERCVSLSDLYDAFIAVKPETGEVSIYVEYECGGEVASFDTELTASYSMDPEGFFKELDDEVTELTSSYRN
jgi:hypothetical protein